jgi:hypothetical protein
LGKKNQTDAGRVSQYTSPLQRNVSLFSQAIGSQASNGIFSLFSGAPLFNCGVTFCTKHLAGIPCKQTTAITAALFKCTAVIFQSTLGCILIMLIQISGECG